MTVSARSSLTAGVAAMVVGAMAIAPIQPSAPASITMDTVRLSAAVQPLVNQVNTVAATVGQSTPAAVVQQPQAQKTAQANNNVSDAINAIYQLVMPYVSYWALDLGPYLLGWIPFGYLISDQLYIWYPNFTEPLTFSAVYDLLIPVVNDFWNPTVWRDGLTAVATTARLGLNTVVNQEIAYIFSLQWFPFPLPPLPPLPFAATKVPAAAASKDAVAPAKPVVSSGTGHSARPQVVAPSTDAPSTAAPATDTLAAAAVTDTTATSKTAKSNAANATSGKSGSAKPGSDAPKKKSTAGSARNHKTAD